MEVSKDKSAALKLNEEKELLQGAIQKKDQEIVKLRQAN